MVSEHWLDKDIRLSSLQSLQRDHPIFQVRKFPSLPLHQSITYSLCINLLLIQVHSRSISPHSFLNSYVFHVNHHILNSFCINLSLHLLMQIVVLSSLTSPNQTFSFLSLEYKTLILIYSNRTLNSILKKRLFISKVEHDFEPWTTCLWESKIGPWSSLSWITQ